MAKPRNLIHLRNSKMILGETYFWTNTIKDWNKLLYNDSYKQVILDSLKNLIERKLIKLYAYVIVPNHIHLIWKLLAFNGKEMPHASFNKFTAHKIVADLKTVGLSKLNSFLVDEQERKYRIWQRDPLAIKIFSIKMLEQKLKYIHNNPLQENWNLVTSPEKYKWSSASYYEVGKRENDFITHYKEDF